VLASVKDVLNEMQA